MNRLARMRAWARCVAPARRNWKPSRISMTMGTVRFNLPLASHVPCWSPLKKTECGRPADGWKDLLPRVQVPGIAGQCFSALAGCGCDDQRLRSLQGSLVQKVGHSRVRSTFNTVEAIVALLITLLISTHEPPSDSCAVSRLQCISSTLPRLSRVDTKTTLPAVSVHDGGTSTGDASS